VKSPPTNTWPPLAEVASALTLSLTYGFQFRALPVDGSMAATRGRVAPPMVVKSPPAYTRVPAGETARARTTPLASGFHGSTSWLVAPNAARWLRVTGAPPPLGVTAVNSPPT
jgi:hypothetical protein